MPLAHSLQSPCQLGVQSPASPSCQGLGLLVSSQAVNGAHSLWAGVGWPRDVTVPMSQPCALFSSWVQNSNPKEKKQNDGGNSVISPNCFSPFISQPRTSPFPAGSAGIPLWAPLGPGPCPQPRALSSRAAGPCRRTADGAASRGKRGRQQGGRQCLDALPGAWMLSRRLSLAGERRQRSPGILPPPRASVLIKAASGRCSINSRHIQLHQPGRP